MRNDTTEDSERGEWLVIGADNVFDTGNGVR